MRIAYVNNNYQLGGGETVVRQLHENCLAAGHDSRLHVTDGKTWPRARGLRPLYPRWLARLSHSRLAPLMEILASRTKWTNRAFGQLARGDADLVHVHNFHGLYASLESLASVAKAKPLVWTFHRFWGITGGCDHPFSCMKYQAGCGLCPQVGQFPIGDIDRTHEEWERKLNTISSAPLHIVAPSRHLAARVRTSVLGRRWPVTVIHNGVDPSKFNGGRKNDASLRAKLGLHPTKIVVLLTNRSFKDPIKGFPAIREAVAQCLHSDVQFVIVGGESSWARTQLPPTIDVVDVGYVSNRGLMAEYCEAADIYLYASEGENFPCATLEAMACECCVVTSPVDGVIEQVENGISGIVSENNSGGALAAVLNQALSQRRDLAIYGKRARDRVISNFSEEAMVRDHLALYSSLIRG